MARSEPRIVTPPPERPYYDTDSSVDDASGVPWWVWTLIGVAVAGGTTTAVVLALEDTTPKFGGTVQW